MPFIEVNLVEGRSADQLRALISEVTDAVARSIDAPRETVRVVRETPATHWAVGDVTKDEQQSLPDQ